MSLLAIDIGAERTGVALSETGLLARPLTTLTGTRAEQVRELFALFDRFQVEVLIVGEPGHTDADHPLYAFMRDVENRLKQERRLLTIAFIDETLTTKEAERIRLETKNPADTDALAAAILLEDYIEREHPHAQ